MFVISAHKYGYHIHSDGPFTLVAGLLAKGQYPEGPATGHLGTDFLGFPVSISEY